MGFNRVWGGPDSIAASHKWEEKKYFEKERKKEKKRNELIRPGLTTARTVMFHRFLFSVWRLFFFCFFLPAVPRARSIEIITDTYINLRRIYMQTVFFFFSLAPLCIFIFFPGDFFLLFYPLICLWSVYRRVEGAKWCAMPTLRSDTFFRDPIPRNVKRK